MNSQATDSMPNGTPGSLESDGAKQAFVGIEDEDAKQAKSSVLEVLKKVRLKPNRFRRDHCLDCVSFAPNHAFFLFRSG